MTRFLALTLAAILGTAATVAAFTSVPDAHRPAVKTSLNYYGSNYGVMDGDDQYYRGTDRYGRSGYGYGGGYGGGGGYGYGGYRTERLSDVGKVSSSRDVMWHIHSGTPAKCGRSWWNGKEPISFCIQDSVVERRARRRCPRCLAMFQDIFISRGESGDRGANYRFSSFFCFFSPCTEMWYM